MQTNPATVTAKWVRNIGAATQSITDGVNAVTVSPGSKAAAQKNLWLQRIQASADKWAQNVGAVSLTTWQQDMITKGIPRIASGAQANQDKVQAFFTQFLPYLAQGVAQVKAMPKGDINAGIARAVAMIQHNAAFNYRKAS